jgi:hypothetical protein
MKLLNRLERVQRETVQAIHEKINKVHRNIYYIFYY